MRDGRVARVEIGQAVSDVEGSPKLHVFGHYGTELLNGLDILLLEEEQIAECRARAPLKDHGQRLGEDAHEGDDVGMHQPAQESQFKWWEEGGCLMRVTSWRMSVKSSDGSLSGAALRDLTATARGAP